MKARLKYVWETVTASYWFVPTLMTAGSFCLWLAMIWLEEPIKDGIVQRFGWIFGGSPEGAREVLSALAGSTITVTGVVFSVTIVALTVASAQLGPRLLRHFMNDKGNQIVLGAFISTFLFCLLVLRSVRGTEDTIYVPHISVTIGVILAVGSVGVFIYFIHHVASLIQAPRMIATVARELDIVLKSIFEKQRDEGVDDEAGSVLYNLPEVFDAELTPIVHTVSGYVETIDEQGIIETATRHDLLVRLMVRPGDFVLAGSTVAKVFPGQGLDEGVAGEISGSVIVGQQRTPAEDITYLLDELTEIAIRSLSPSVNDPFTAMTCIDYLSVALVKIGNLNAMSIYKRDKEGKVRIIRETVDFKQAVDRTLGHIREYASSPTVLVHLLDTLRAIALLVPSESARRELLRQAKMIKRKGKNKV
ncbi:MAG: DUF2254 domain-containing protein, partial [Syntrophorhabdus sp.]